MEKEIIIPKGNTPEDNKARRRIIKEYYSKWIMENPDKKVWNGSLGAYIHIKGISINEILGHAPRSVESMVAQFYLTEILSEAELVNHWPPKYGDKNQKPFSRMFLLKWRQCRLLIGLQKSTSEYVLYYISGGQKIKAAR